MSLFYILLGVFCLGIVIWDWIHAETSLAAFSRWLSGFDVNRFDYPVVYWSAMTIQFSMAMVAFYVGFGGEI